MTRIPPRAGVTRTLMLTLFLLGLLIPQASANEGLNEAKQRAAERYPTLMKLKEAGKIGESYTGYVGVVEDQYRDDKAKPDEKDSPTVGELVSAENTYRQKVYQRIAEKVGVSAEQVARRKAEQNFKEASPETMLKVPDRGWIKKKALSEN